MDADLIRVRRPLAAVALACGLLGAGTGLAGLAVASQHAPATRPAAPAVAGALQVPATAAVADWYSGSARPGAIGAAVIGGHIDSRQGPGVFYRLITCGGTFDFATGHYLSNVIAYATLTHQGRS